MGFFSFFLLHASIGTSYLGGKLSIGQNLKKKLWVCGFSYSNFMQMLKYLAEKYHQA